jgi:site-specific DNA-methyltransferase (adenine-specific)
MGDCCERRGMTAASPCGDRHPRQPAVALPAPGGCLLLVGDMLERLKDLPGDSIDSCVCDPPYHLTSIVQRFGSADAAPVKRGAAANATGAYARASKGFMGQTWDGGDVAFRVETWAEVLRVLKPGGHLVAFSGTRTYHRMAVAIEDAGFEVRDMIAWHYGSGFPKSRDISKAIDKAAGAEREVVGLNPNHRAVSGVTYEGVYSGGNTGAEHITAPETHAAREWEGWGTALKPATEPICLARKPISEKSVAANVLKWGTGALNIGGCRIGTDELTPRNNANTATLLKKGFEGAPKTIEPSPLGRWPANLCHDGSDEVVAGFPETASGGGNKRSNAPQWGGRASADFIAEADSGSAARFFYCAKADGDERGSKCLICGAIAADEAEQCACVDPETGKPKRLSHPTVKPHGLMTWLVRLVTPKGGIVLDPFMGTGSTGVAAQAEQLGFVGAELSPDYAAIAQSRLKKGAGLFADVRMSACPPPHDNPVGLGDDTESKAA